MSYYITIVAKYEDGENPKIGADTEIVGGKPVAVDFSGNRLDVCNDLEDALEELLCLADQMLAGESDEQKIAHAALARARGEAE